MPLKKPGLSISLDDDIFSDDKKIDFNFDDIATKIDSINKIVELPEMRAKGTYGKYYSLKVSDEVIEAFRNNGILLPRGKTIGIKQIDYLELYSRGEKGVSSELFVDIIRNEHNILTNLNSTGITPAIYGAFYDDNYVYLILEHIDGVTFQSMMESKELSIKDAKEYILKLGNVLLNLHSLDLAHRDLKPDNIMVSDDGNIILIDVGLACHKDAKKNVDACMSGTGAKVYSILAPVDGREIDLKTQDLWSYCVIICKYIFKIDIMKLRHNSGDLYDILIEIKETIPNHDIDLFEFILNFAEINKSHKLGEDEEYPILLDLVEILRHNIERSPKTETTIMLNAITGGFDEKSLGEFSILKEDNINDVVEYKDLNELINNKTNSFGLTIFGIKLF